MTPEAAAHLQRAEVELQDARRAFSYQLFRIAARGAYYAAFRAAEAFITERTGKVAKTHNGVRTEFSRLWRQTPGADSGAMKVLPRGYAFKETADYGFGPGDGAWDRDAAEMIEEAARFLERVTALLSGPSTSPEGS